MDVNLAFAHNYGRQISIFMGIQLHKPGHGANLKHGNSSIGPTISSSSRTRNEVSDTLTDKEQFMKSPSQFFDYSLDFKTIDFRQHPNFYRVGKGEQGVLLVEPYKSEILPHWKFKTVADAKKSSAKIYKMFLMYLKASDFPGADMARKFLQMGWTRARRYANHQGGRKYDKAGKKLPRTQDPEKATSAAIFYERYVAAREHADYI